MLKLIHSLSRRQKAWIFLAIDLALIPLALLFTYSVQALPQPAFDTMARSLSVLPFLMLAAAGLSWALGIPQIVLNDYEARAVLLTAAFAALLAVTFGGLSWLAGLGPALGIGPGTHVIFALSYFLFAVAARALLYRLVSAIYSRGQPQKPVLIYGAGTTGTQLARALRAHESIVPVAFVDDNAALHGVMLAGLPVYPPTRLAELAEKRRIRRVLLAMPSLSQPK